MQNGKLEINSQEIPVIRRLKRVEGPWQMVKETLLHHVLEPGQLTTWVELWIHSDESPVSISSQVRKLAEEIRDTVRIVDFRQKKTDVMISGDVPKILAEALEDLQPMDVFTRLLEANHIHEGREKLLEAFAELLSQDVK
jgi:hypothetical protein